MHSRTQTQVGPTLSALALRFVLPGEQILFIFSSPKGERFSDHLPTSQIRSFTQSSQQEKRKKGKREGAQERTVGFPSKWDIACG